MSEAIAKSIPGYPVTGLQTRNPVSMRTKEKLEGSEMAGNPIEPLLSSNEVGQILGIHPKVVERMVKRGEIPGFKVSKFYRFSAAAIQAGIDARSQSAVESDRRACRIRPIF